LIHPDMSANVTMDNIDTGRRKTMGMLAGALAFAAGAALPVKALTRTGSRSWPLWTIRRGSKTIYLTAETPPQPTDWHDPSIEQLLMHRSALWTETNSVYRQSQNELIRRYGVDARRPLDAWLDAHDKARLAKAAAYCGLKPGDLAPYRPWLAGSILQEQFYQIAGWKGKSARDVLVDRATRAGTPWHSEFKAKDDVFAWFGAFTPLQDIQYLRYMLDEVLAGPAHDAGIFVDWAAGRVGAAAAEVQRYSHAYPELAHKLTFERNQGWLARFEDMLASGSTPLVVVGLYHMVGPTGILALAKHKGLAVESLQDTDGPQ
jgi:uncharacterized protein YbaP (TraB family)